MFTKVLQDPREVDCAHMFNSRALRFRFRFLHHRTGRSSPNRARPWVVEVEWGLPAAQVIRTSTQGRSLGIHNGYGLMLMRCGQVIHSVGATYTGSERRRWLCTSVSLLSVQALIQPDPADRRMGLPLSTLKPPTFWCFMGKEIFGFTVAGQWIQTWPETVQIVPAVGRGVPPP